MKISPRLTMQQVGQIDGNNVYHIAQGGQEVFMLDVDGKITAFVGFDQGKLKNVKNFTQTAGVVRALIGYLVHKIGRTLIISSDEPLTADGLKWISHLVFKPQGLKITDQHGSTLDTVNLKNEWMTTIASGTAEPTSIHISENVNFGNKLRINEARRSRVSILMPVNFYDTVG